MDTFFATPHRVSGEHLAAEINIVTASPLVSGLLGAVGGVLAVLDRYRQIVAVNDTFLQFLQIENFEDVLGLRPGEALQCVHAFDAPSGCGTTQFCSSCGAAIAIVSSLATNVPTERMCVLAANVDGTLGDMVFKVRSQPVSIGGAVFILLFLQDITQDYQRAALERTFFHDINNLLQMLSGASELLLEVNDSTLAKSVHQTALRLCNEVAIQQCLAGQGKYQPKWESVSIASILDDIELFFTFHPAVSNKQISICGKELSDTLTTDVSLLLRVVYNMVLNALEATADFEQIKVWVEPEEHSCTFCVWNKSVIPPEIALRVFQRNFSSKEQYGRGLGTYSMKLFGESVLGGIVNFTSSEEHGTVFRFIHPC